MKSSPFAFYLVAFTFVSLAAWRVVTGVETAMQLAVLFNLVFGTMASIFLIHAGNMTINGGGVTIEIIRQSVDTFGIGGKGGNRSVSSDQVDTVGSSDHQVDIGPQSSKIIAETTLDYDPDDPNKGRFGSSSHSDGLKISAAITPHPEDKDAWAVIKVTVTDDRKLGSVRIYLHPSFTKSKIDLQQHNGVSELVVVGWGAFTIGAKTPDGRMVELDLTDCPGGPSVFYLN